MTDSSPVRRLGVVRVLLLLGAGVAAAGATTLAATDSSPTDAAGVARMLGDAVAGEVGVHDFVWAPPTNAVSDAALGRWVVFSARHGARPRDVYLGRVRLTRAGRPFDVSTVRRLTETPFGDEHAVDMAHGRIGFVTDVDGRPRAITAISGLIGPSSEQRPSLVQARLGDAAGAVLYQLGEGELVVSGRGGELAARVDLGAATVEAEPGLEIDVVRADVDALIEPTRPAWQGHGLADTWPAVSSSAPIQEAPGETSALPGASVVVASALEGADPLVSRVDDTTNGATVVAFDMRQLDAALVTGHPPGAARTGLVARGAWPSRERRVAAVFRGPVAPPTAWIGLVDRAPIQPPSPALDVLSFSGGEMILSPLGTWSSAADTAIQLGTAHDASARRRAAICISDEGQLAYVTGEHVRPANLTGACDRWGGHLSREIVRTDDAHDLWVSAGPGNELRLEVGAPGDPPAADRAPKDHLFVLTAHAETPPAALSGLKWKPVAGDQPTPAFVPALFEADVEELGEAVRVVRVAPGRLLWRLRAGTEERSHRDGGDFPEELPPAEASRAVFAFSVGVGKRRGPNGLRIDGSTGHKFRGNPVLVADGRALRFAPESAAADAVELEATLAEGKVTPRGRARGPRQRRADLCILEDGALLLAESTFDSHEVTATVLGRLGCGSAVALDRGAERESWLALRQTDQPVGTAHVETAFIGLDVPLRGRATSVLIRPVPSDQVSSPP